MKDKRTAFILAVLLGLIGAHSIYLNQRGQAVFYLAATLFCWHFQLYQIIIIIFIICVIQGFQIISLNWHDFNGKYNR